VADGLTDAELALLGLLAEQSRHGYQLEAVIAERGVREWTSLAFSSIYYLLNKLESRGLVASERPEATAKGRRIYSLTSTGVAACVAGTRDALERVDPLTAPVLVGMANSPMLPPGQVAESLRRRRESVSMRIESIRAARLRQEPVEEFVAVIFEHGITMLRAELTWIDNTLSRLEENRMRTYDIKKERKDLYAPKPGDFAIVDVPDMGFLMIDGHGDPNTSVAYREAVEALYAASYAVRSVAKTRLGRVHTVAPLEGLWSAEDLEVFRTRDKSAWDWTMMIAQPEWITADLVDDALATARKKQLPALNLVRFERYTEGRSAQILHVGSYDDEGPTLQRMHDEFLPANGLAPRGRHHEVYLSDARKIEPARLKTILRQPVTAG
jgi:DNA-binding PadR family transcriptional regulator